MTSRAVKLCSSSGTETKTEYMYFLFVLFFCQLNAQYFVLNVLFLNMNLISSRLSMCYMLIRFKDLEVFWNIFFQVSTSL